MERKEKEVKLAEEIHEGTKNEGMDIEPLLQALGYRGFGPYQCIQAILQLLCLFPVAFSVMAQVFIGFKPPYRCASVNDSKLAEHIGWPKNMTNTTTVQYGQCNIHVQTNDSGQLEIFSLPCVEGYEYEADKDSTIFTEWDLTCEKSALTEVSQTLMMVGQALGAFTFTSIADRFGRKPVYVTCSLCMMVMTVAMALSPNYIVFTLCRVVLGGLQQGSGLVGYTMFVELLPQKLRKMAGVIDGGMWSLAIMVLPALAFLLRHHSWRHLTLAMATFSLYALLLPWCVDESLRWLVANKKRERAEYVLRRACRINKIPFHRVHEALDAILCGQPMAEVVTSPLTNQNTENTLGDATSGTNKQSDKLRLDENGHEEAMNGKAELPEAISYEPNTSSTDPEVVKKYSALDILRSKFMMKITFAITYLWVANGLTYYGLMLTSATVAGNLYLNFFLRGLMEFPAYVTVYFCLRKFGRRTVTIAFLTLSAISLLLSSLLLGTVSSPVVGPITNVLSLMGKYGISGSFSTLFIFCPELYPTNLRNAGLGISSSFARVGGMVAPFSYNLAAVAVWAPSLLFGLMNLLGTYIMHSLPETRGRSMPTTIEELKLMYSSGTTRGKEKDKNPVHSPDSPDRVLSD